MNIIDFSSEQSVHNYGKDVLDELKELRDSFYEDEWDISRVMKIGTKQFQNPLLPLPIQEKTKEKLLDIAANKITYEEIECCYMEYYVNKLGKVKDKLSDTISFGKDQVFDTVPKTDIEEKNMDYMLKYLGMLGVVENSINLEMESYNSSVELRKKLRDAYEEYSTSLEKVPSAPVKEKLHLKMKRFIGE